MWAFCEHVTRNVINVEPFQYNEIDMSNCKFFKVPMIGTGI
jgi:hypothetical protein